MSDYNEKVKSYLLNICNKIKNLKKCFERISFNLVKYVDLIDKEVATKFQDPSRDDKLRMFIETLISGIYDSLTDINYRIKPSFMFYLQKYTQQLLNINDLKNLLISEDVKDVFKQIIIYEFNSNNIIANVEKVNSTNTTFSLHFDLEYSYILEDTKLNLISYLVRLLSFNFDKEEDDIQINFSADDNALLVINGIINTEPLPELEPDKIGYANVPTYDIGFGGNFNYRTNIDDSISSPWYETGNLPVISPIKFSMKQYILNNCEGLNSSEVGFVNAFGDLNFYIPGIQILYDPVKINLKIRLTTITEQDVFDTKKEIFKYLPSGNEVIKWFTSEWTPHIKNINDIALILNEDENDKFHLTDEEVALEQKLRIEWHNMNESLTNNNDMHYLLASLSNYIVELDKYTDFIQKRRYVIN